MRSFAANQAAPNTSGTAMIVNAWVVQDGHQEEFVETLVGLFNRARMLDGFVEGELLQGANPKRFVSYVRMRSALDRQRALDDSEVREILQAAGDVARSDLHSYDVLRVFRPSVA